MTYKNIFISLGLLIIAGFAIWTTLLSHRPSQMPVVQSKEVPDAFMEDVTALIMDKQGKPKLKIVTPKMVHYTTNDTTHLTTPQLTLYRKSPQPWYIASQYAKASQGIEIVDFWDNVTIHHAADEENPATVIKTSTLRVHPEKQTAETNDFITMTQPNTIIKAVGMRADMEAGIIKLLSQARGEYVPGS